MQETHHITHSAAHFKAYAVTFRHIAGRSPHLRLRPRAGGDDGPGGAAEVTGGGDGPRNASVADYLFRGLLTSARARARTLLPLAPRCAPHCFGSALQPLPGLGRVRQ